MSNRLYPSDSFEITQRKKDHIELTPEARTLTSTVDERFNYEPLFFTHPTPTANWPTKFLGFDLDLPLWISSMTGGVDHAKNINQNLAKLCGEFKLGMGLGSCRVLLDSRDRLADFKVRPFLGDQPLFANMGIAQVGELIIQNRSHQLRELLQELEANGLIIHLNPLQEWFQPGGDRFELSAFEILQRFLEDNDYPVIVKEVGQGLGPRSLAALLKLPIHGIEFGAYGGTNFSLLESLRNSESHLHKKPFINVGHTAAEMIDILNALPIHGKEFIISGGVKNVLDGYELKMRLKAPSLIGMASALLAPAQKGYEDLKAEFLQMREGLLVAKHILDLKDMT